MTSVFIYNDVSKKLNATKVTTQIISKLFNLEISSISLLCEDGKKRMLPKHVLDGEFYEPDSGTFSGLENGKEYQINGNLAPATVVSIAPSAAVSALATKPAFTSADMKSLENAVILQTVDMNDRLKGVARAPSAVAMIQTLAILTACTSDPSLLNEKTKKRIELLRTPGSLKASLVQVVNESTHAFLTADSGMSKIKMNLATVPDTLVTSLEAASDPSDPGSPKVLEVNEKAITRIADLCAQESKKVAGAFQGVMNLIDELLEVATATQGVSEEECRKLENLRREYQAQKKHLEDEEKLKQVELEKQQRETEEALQAYKEKAKDMGDMGKIFVACVADTLTNLTKTTSHVIGSTVNTVTDTVKNGVNLIGRPLLGESAKYNHWAAKTYEDGLLRFLENFCVQEFPSQQDLIKNADFEKECFAAFLKYKACTPEGTHMMKVSKEYVQLLDNVNDPAVYSQLQAKFKVLEVAAQNARSSRDEETKKEAEQMKAAAGILEQINSAASEAQSNYRAERQREDKLMDEAAQFRRDISDLATKLENSRVEKLDLEDIIKYLGKGLIILGNLKDAWVSQEQFFTSVANTVSQPMKETLHSFLEQQKNLTATPSSNRLKKDLICTAMKACGICLRIQSCADIYQEISQKYVIPKITNVTQNLQLTKDEAQSKLRTINQSFKELEEEVGDLIQDRKGKMMVSSTEQIAGYAKQLAITDK